MAALAALADGSSELGGIARARLKESNRVAAIKQELSKMGIRVIESEDSLRIIGGRPHGAVIDSHDDHRLAMAFGLLGSVVGDTTIMGAEFVSKTFPDFWEVFQELGGQVRLEE